MDDSDGDDEEGEEAPTHTFDDDSEDDTVHPQQLLSFVGATQAPSKYIRFSNHVRVLRQMRTYRTSSVRRSFMSGTTRTGRDGSREGYMGATSKRVILRVLPQPIFLCDTASR